MNDVLLSTDYDLVIADGDFAFGDSTQQCVELLFVSTPGEWKEHIETGIGIKRLGNGSLDRFIDRTIRVQMDADGFKIKTLQLNSAGITIDGSYEKL